jgi:hypothetical protein
MFGFRRKFRHGPEAAAPDPSRGLTIAMGMPTSADERDTIEAAIGLSYRVVDIREAPVDTSLVVVGPCSAAAIERLRTTFPQAGVLVVERQATTGAGPVINALRAGALAYIVAGSQPLELSSSNAA